MQSNLLFIFLWCFIFPHNGRICNKFTREPIIDDDDLCLSDVTLNLSSQSIFDSLNIKKDENTYHHLYLDEARDGRIGETETSEYKTGHVDPDFDINHVTHLEEEISECHPTKCRKKTPYGLVKA